MLQATLEVLTQIVGADTFCYAVALMLAGAAGVIIVSSTASFSLAAAYVPVIAFGALSGIYGAREFGIPLTHDYYMDVVISAGAGAIAGLAVMMALTHFLYAAIRIRKPVTVSTRNVYRI